MFPLVHTIRIAPHANRSQKGAAFIVMMVILIMGVTAALVGALSKVGLQTARNEKNADLLAQAKEVVIGYALNGSGSSQRPGDLMRPDVAHEATPDYDGTSESGCLDSTQSNGMPLTTNASKIRCLGRLPWKNYGLSIESPSENDPLGVMSWYAISSNLYDYPSTKLNSELLDKSTGWITVRDMKGNVLSNRVVFVVIIPNTPLPGQSRPATPLRTAVEYLDGITVPVGCTAPCIPGRYNNYDMRDEADTANNELGFIMGEEHRWIDDPANPGKQIEDTSYSFNDKLLYVTIDELMPLIEKRIAREVKACLDDYTNMPTASPSHKYPWAAPVSDLTFATTPNTRFGRIPATPTISVVNPTLTAALNNLQTALNNLQVRETACQTSDSFFNTNALTNAANALLTATGNITAPPFTSSPQLTALVTSSNAAALAAKPTSAGGSTYSDPCGYIDGGHPNSQVQTKLNSAISAFPGVSDTGPEDSSMEPTWLTTSSCNALFTSSYWDEWKELVFYQVDDKFRPNGTVANCSNDCLSISGSGNASQNSGNYRATILVAGKMVGTQMRTTNTNKQDRNNYLEGTINPVGKTNIPTTSNFETYKISDSNYQSATNDLVLCVDGKINCQ